MNVGDPDRSFKEESIGKYKYKSESAEMTVRKSDGS